MNLETYFIYTIFILGIILLINLILKKVKKTTKKNHYLFKQIKSIFIILIIVIALRSFIIEPCRIPSGSMKPTLLIGDFILINKFQYNIKLPIINKELFTLNKPQKGDIIVFKHIDGDYYIKRIIGLPGDYIQYKNKKLYINNINIKKKYKGKYIDLNDNIILETLQYKEYLTPTTEYMIYNYKNINNDDYKYFDTIIPEDSYFVLGDNRDNSEDSRFWGFVKKKNIMGKAFITWFSIDYEINDIRWDKIYNKIK